MPGNDDAIRACALITRVIADSIAEGRQKVSVKDFQPAAQENGAAPAASAVTEEPAAVAANEEPTAADEAELVAADTVDVPIEEPVAAAEPEVAAPDTVEAPVDETTEVEQ